MSVKIRREVLDAIDEQRGSLSQEEAILVIASSLVAPGGWGTPDCIRGGRHQGPVRRGEWWSFSSFRGRVQDGELFLEGPGAENVLTYLRWRWS